MEQLKRYPTVGVCGLDCGLCPRYYTNGPSRCPGCGGPGFYDKHPSCSFITCCVKKQNLEACGQCRDFPCSKFKAEEEYRGVPASSSYPPYSKVLTNLTSIKEEGIRTFASRQAKRISLLQIMLESYDDGRSKSFFCRAAALLDPATLRSSLVIAEKALATSNGGKVSTAEKAKMLKAILVEAAAREAIDLGVKR